MNTSPVARSLSDPASPLLRRTALLPNESLASLLERLTLLNFYTSRSLIEMLGRQRLATVQIVANLAAPTRLETFQELARLTGLTLEALYAASHQRFADWLAPLDQPAPQTPWLDGTARPRLDAHHASDHLRLRTSVQFCPHCLATAAYQRLSWLPRTAAICLEHHCLLLDRCLRCGAALTVTDLVTCRCHICQIELHRLNSVSLTTDLLGLRSQQIIQGWFGMIDPPTEALAACHLPPQSPRVLYRSLQLIVRQLLKGQTEWVNLPHPLADLAKLRATTTGIHGRLTSEQAYVLYRCAFAGLLDWPTGLEQLLDAYGGCDETQTRPPSRRHCLHRIQCDWFRLDWQASSLAFVQPVLLDYVLKRGLGIAPSALEQLKDVRWFAERTSLWTEEQTGQVLELSLDGLRRLCGNGSLLDCLAPSVPTRTPRFKSGAVLEAKQRWIAGWSLQDASSWLGLTLADVLDLVKVGLLPVDKGWPGDGEQSLVKRQAVEELFAQVGARLEPVPESGYELIPWRTAVGEVRRWGIDTAVLIQCVLIGLVSAYCTSMRRDGLKGIYFSQVAIRNLPEQFYAIGGLVLGAQFAFDYGFAPVLISKWCQKRLIKPTVSFKGNQYFDHEQLKDLAAQHGFVSPVGQPVRKRLM